MFDTMMAAAAAEEGVPFEPGEVGRRPGLVVPPDQRRSGPDAALRARLRLRARVSPGVPQPRRLDRRAHQGCCLRARLSIGAGGRPRSRRLSRVCSPSIAASWPRTAR